MTISPALLVLIVAIFAIAGLIFYLFWRQLDSLRRQVGDSLSQSSTQLEQKLQMVDQQVRDSYKQLGDVRQALGELSKSAEQIMEVGKGVSALQDILRAPKLRGGLGELMLEELLRQILPQKYYQLPYKFKSGEMVDAVVRVGGRLVPIDSKFPLENFRRMMTSQDESKQKETRRAFVRDVKKHVDDIASKYILPDEGTYDFALMYVPAENVYYETIIKDAATDGGESLSTYAVARKVIPVSPNSLYAYLMVIVLGLQGLEVEKRAEEIIKYLSSLKGDFGRFREHFDVLGTHLTHSRQKYDDAQKSLGRLEDRIHHIEESSTKALPSESESEISISKKD
ncbi:MAG: DNA recombination protein RmuC [Acidobacteriota bacterium]